LYKDDQTHLLAESLVLGTKDLVELALRRGDDRLDLVLELVLAGLDTALRLLELGGDLLVRHLHRLGNLATGKRLGVGVKTVEARHHAGHLAVEVLASNAGHLGKELKEALALLEHLLG